MNATNTEHTTAITTPSPARPRGLRGARGWQIAAAAVLVILALLGIGYFLMVQGMNDANTPPPGLNTSWTQTSAKGLYRGTVAPSMEPIVINKLHSWRLHLETADGRPVDDAIFTIKGDMPGHGHGLPTQPAVTQKLGNGDYLADGMKFQMTGWWYVDFGITSSQGNDTLRFNFILK